MYMEQIILGKKSITDVIFHCIFFATIYDVISVIS